VTDASQTDDGPALPERIFAVSWEELHRNAKALAWRLHDLGQWSCIVAITRGGLVRPPSSRANSISA